MQWTCRFLLIIFANIFVTNTSADNTSYLYDEFGRIKQIQYRSKQQHYIYDDVGNRVDNIITNSDLNNSTDTDGDGIPNSWESLYGLNPLYSGDASEDSDADGLNNLQEYQADTDPFDADTDDDGINDSQDPNPTFNPVWLIPITSLLLN